MNKKNERKELHEEHEAVEALRCICRELGRIGDLLEQALSARGLQLTQSGGNDMGVITGIQPGKTATFALSTLPVGSLLKAGSIPTYTQDNTADVSPLIPAADGMSFSITGNPTFVGTSVNVTANAISLDGTALTMTFNIPLLAPAPVPATGLDLNQIS